MKKNYPGVTKSQTDFSHQPLVAHRSPPCSFFCKCILHSAIDFAERRKRSWARSWRRGRLCTWA